MKKLVTIVISIVLLLAGGIYVNRHLPEWMIKYSLSYLEKTDYEVILNSDELDEDERIIAKEVLTTATYEILETEIIGDEATVSVDLTLLDLLQLVEEEKSTLFQNALSDWQLLLNHLVNQEIETMFVHQVALLLEHTSSRPMTELTVKVPFVRSYLWWELNITDEWLEAVLSEYLSYS